MLDWVAEVLAWTDWNRHLEKEKNNIVDTSVVNLMKVKHTFAEEKSMSFSLGNT